jgi:hypothetical protein
VAARCRQHSPEARAPAQVPRLMRSRATSTQ